jgi:hypothetical protein
MFHREVVENIKTHIVCLVMFFFLNHAIDEIMWENTVKLGGPQLMV